MRQVLRVGVECVPWGPSHGQGEVVRSLQLLVENWPDEMRRACWRSRRVPAGIPWNPKGRRSQAGRCVGLPAGPDFSTEVKVATCTRHCQGEHFLGHRQDQAFPCCGGTTLAF